MSMRRAIAVSAGIYFAALAYLGLRWGSIPDPMPVHVGPGGKVDNWAPKTWLSVGGAIWVGVVVCAVMALCTPRLSLVSARREVAEPDALPYSNTAAARAELLISMTIRFMGHLLVATTVLLVATQLTLALSHQVPIAVWVVAFAAYLALSVVASIRISKRAKTSWDTLPPDAEEQVRVERLKNKAGMGVYSEERDPMAVAVLPAEPGKVQINSAHPAGKRTLRNIMCAIVGSLAATVALVVFL
ncbi:DUF1648 domain-containing protein [Corynebacterium bouchesdurhonense]|uniref:DUF1648 domain-containing protein n=1 Tax=Corynebacterium bouchesdurhonense TaxID=1720192 RepID=UPI00098FDBD5|nr:DUF1648 domain-containing protein [Corynebacterium bouchesdurhonense]